MLDVGCNIPVELYEVVAGIYCKLMETSAQIRGVEKAAAAKALEGKLQGREARPAVCAGIWYPGARGMTADGVFTPDVT